MLNSPEEYQRMAEVEATHWWYATLHNLVLRELREFKVELTAPIVDAGCGTGGLLRFLGEKGFSNLQGFDVSDFALEHARRNLSVKKSGVLAIEDLYAPESLAALTCNDVLYFLSDDDLSLTLKKFSSRLRKGGILLVNLPALKAFSGSHDISVGITRRMSIPHLKELYAGSGLTIRKIFYWPFFLALPILLVRTWQRIRLGGYPEESCRSDVAAVQPQLNSLLRALCSLETRLLPWKPFGSSVFCVATKDA